jgi:hypothetical protein
MPAIATSMTAVNAAFLQEIKEDHRELHDAISRLTDHLDPDSIAVTWRCIVEDLQCLRDRLAMHFALEEGYGYCDDAIEVAPRLSERAHALRAEHSTLYLRLDDIVERAERILFHEPASEHRNSVNKEVREFLQAVDRHERREGDLILEAYAQDIGSGD